MRATAAHTTRRRLAVKEASPRFSVFCGRIGLFAARVSTRPDSRGPVPAAEARR
jgi:hypothetical protein